MNVFISRIVRRHLYTNESLSSSGRQFVGRALEKKLTTSVGERDPRTLGMGLAHRTTTGSHAIDKMRSLGNPRRGLDLNG
jgi:hypothetical protein